MKNALQYGLTLLAIAIIVMWQAEYNPFASTVSADLVVTPTEFKEMKLNADNDGKQIAIVGVFSVFNSDLTIRLGKSVSMTFVDENGSLIDFFNLDFGTGKNEFHLPNTFTPEDLQIYDNEKKAHPYNEKIKLSFTLDRNEDAMPEKNPTTGEYSWNHKYIRIDELE